MSGSGGPKTAVDTVDKEEKRGKRHSEHPANSRPRTEQDQSVASQIISGRREAKEGHKARRRERRSPSKEQQ